MKNLNAVSFVCLLVLLARTGSRCWCAGSQQDVAPILTKYCTGCHNDADREGRLSLQTYESLLKGGERGGYTRVK